MSAAESEELANAGLRRVDIERSVGIVADRRRILIGEVGRFDGERFDVLIVGENGVGARWVEMQRWDHRWLSVAHSAIVAPNKLWSTKTFRIAN